MGTVKCDKIEPLGNILRLFGQPANLGIPPTALLTPAGMVVGDAISAPATNSKLSVNGNLSQAQLILPDSVASIGTNSTFTLVETNSATRLYMGVPISGGAWIQAINVSGSAAIANLSLNPLGGTCSIGKNDNVNCSLTVLGKHSPTNAIVKIASNAASGNAAALQMGTEHTPNYVWIQGVSGSSSPTSLLVLQKQGGNVAIGTSDTTSASLKVWGGITATGAITPGSWVQGSCPRLYIYTTIAAANTDAPYRPYGSLVVIGQS